MALLTIARREVVRAIQSSLGSRIRRYWTYEDRPGRTPGPTLGDLPALEIYPDGGQTPWRLNQSQSLEYRLRLSLWTGDWDVTTGEDLWEAITRALWTGFDRSNPTSASMRLLEVGLPSPVVGELGDAGGPATKWDWGITVRVGGWNPTL